MSLASYNFQFYSYKIPTHRYAANDGTMDVDDVDMSIPPPKPPRTFAVHKNNNAFAPTDTSQISWVASTSENTIVPTPAAVAAPTPAVNYCSVPNETQKSIYFSGLTEALKAKTEPAELQLRPKLHATQRRWSSDLKEKLMELTRRRSTFSEEIKCKTNNNPSPMQTDEEPLQLKPQHHSEHKSLSSEIRQKALEMSKRNSGSFETSMQAAVTPMKNSAKTSAATNQRNSVTFKIPLVNAEAYEKINLIENTVSSPTQKESYKTNTTFGAFFRSPQQANTDELPAQSEDITQSVKERISFFNKLTSPRSNSFIDLLKNNKSTTLATKQHCSSAQTSPLPTPLKPRRLPTQLELNLQQEFFTYNIQLSQPQTNAAISFPPTSFRKTETVTKSPPLPVTSSPATSGTTIQRKSSLRRKSSMEKSRRPIVRQNSNASSKGTKPQMHSVMEDLSLVMPVKLRIAEYERRIKMKC